MKRIGIAIALSLSACQLSPEVVRVAGDADTKAIFAEITNGMPQSFCVSREIKAPLEDQRRFRLYNRERRSWLSSLKMLLPMVWSSGEDAKGWIEPLIVDRSVPIALKTAKILERRLSTAARMHLQAKAVLATEKVLPAKLLEPAGANDNLPCGGKGIEISLSIPVIVGNTAFVETGTNCGGLCGGGDIEAYNFESGKWRLVARKPTWIA